MSNHHRVLSATTFVLAASIATNVAGAQAGTKTPPVTSMQQVVKHDYKKPSDSELKQKLSPMQYDVTQHEATEPPFRNEYWNNHEAGIYVEVTTGEPLFSSLDKYESGTGWPSFTKPLEPANVKTKTDRQMLMERNEVRSVHGDAHLGHLFDDGPKPLGLRYCMNSAAMRFLPVSRLEAEGYGQYLPLFKMTPAKSTAAKP